MLDPDQLFKLGFLLAAAADGLDADDALSKAAALADRLEKRAEDPGLLGTIRNAFGFLPAAVPYAVDGGRLAVGLAGMGLAGASAAGIGGGYLAGRLADGVADPASIRKQELIAAFNAHAEDVRRRDALRRARQHPSRSRGVSAEFADPGVPY